VFEFSLGVVDSARFAVHDLGWPIMVVAKEAGITRWLCAEATTRAMMPEGEQM
jgi:hypothetical protein